ncbi:MAG: hypothetical protein AseanaTS_04570 [Candidatus Pelagadaptatus aseana]|uniref:phage holin family protein n=1 Tax=Candidatus Pelagadaptatus aseana TaxID=3120508 RepID=UPI0039B319B0
MDNNIEKAKMLYEIEKCFVKTEIKQQKKSVIFLGIAIALAGITLFAINVAIGLSLSDLDEYAKNAWIIAGINAVLLCIPVACMIPKPIDDPDKAALRIRDALLNDLQQDFDDKLHTMQDNIERIDQWGKDFKAFTEGGVTALIPLVKTVVEMVNKPTKKDH